MAENLVMVHENEHKALTADLNKTIVEFQDKITALKSEIDVLNKEVVNLNEIKAKLLISEATVVEKDTVITDLRNQLSLYNESQTTLKELNSLKLQLESETSAHAVSLLKVVDCERLVDTLRTELDSYKDLSIKNDVELKNTISILKHREGELHERFLIEKQLNEREQNYRVRVSELEAKLQVLEEKYLTLTSEKVTQDLMRENEFNRMSELKSRAITVKEDFSNQIESLCSRNHDSISKSSPLIEKIEKSLETGDRGDLLRQLDGHEKEIASLKLHKMSIESAVAEHRSAMHMLSLKLTETQDVISRLAKGTTYVTTDKSNPSDNITDEKDYSDIEAYFSGGNMRDNFPRAMEPSIFYKSLREFIGKEKSYYSSYDKLSTDKSSLILKVSREKAFIDKAFSLLLVDKETIKTLQSHLQRRKEEWKQLKSHSSTKRDIILSGEVINRLATKINRAVRENKFIKSWLDKRYSQILAVEEMLEVNDYECAQLEFSIRKIAVLDSELDSCLQRSSKENKKKKLLDMKYY